MSSAFQPVEVACTTGCWVDCSTLEARWQCHQDEERVWIRKQRRCRHSILHLDRRGRSASQSEINANRDIFQAAAPARHWLKARIANAVGTTQLHVSGNHGQPNLSGSKRTWRSAVRNFHLQNQLASLPRHFISQWMPASLAGIAVATSRRAIAARDVTQAPS